MIDQIFEKASLPWLVAAAIAALVLSRVARYVQEAKKIRQLAGYAVKRPTWLPFGELQLPVLLILRNLVMLLVR